MQKFTNFQLMMWTLFLHLSWCAVLQNVTLTSLEDNTKCDRNVKDGMGNSFLWSVKRDPPSYLFGTIHVPYTRVWDHIPSNAKAAFKQSENVYFELDLTDPYTARSLANCQLLPLGENLSDVLPEDLYTRLKDHLRYIREKMFKWITPDQKGKGLYADYLFDIIAGDWERKRPIWVMLLVNSLTESDIKSREIPVLDLYLAQEAERLRKVTGAIEEVEEQCVPLNDLNYSQVLFALNRTLRQHESYRLQNSAIPFTTDHLIHHYNCGDLDIIFNKDSAQVPYLLNISQAPSELNTAKLIDDYFRTELINKRNERMANRVAKLLNDHPEESFFFAFGAGHFLGNNTVIDRLQELGFNVQQTPADEEIPKLNLNRRHKNKRRNKLQEEFGDIWDQMDAESRDWLEKSRTEQRKRYDSNKPFNDLWVRMQTSSPGLIQQIAAESSFYNEDIQGRPTPNGGIYLHNDGILYSMSPFVVTLLFIIYSIFLHLEAT